MVKTQTKQRNINIFVHMHSHLFSTYMNTKMFVCLCVRVFLRHFETNWDTLWHKVAFWPWEGFNTKIYLIGAFIN